jgi:CRP-like cAMP-binding protein
MATATALEDTVCVAVPTAVFNSELDDISAFLKALILNLIGRLRSMSDNLESYQQAEAEKEGVVFFRPDEDGEYHEAE